jgi:phosphoribosylanthranilate isomerase
MSIEVKICGINSLEAADAAVRGGAEFVGLNFHPGSPRFLKPDMARALAERMRGRTRLVALLSDPSDDAVADAVRWARPDLVQLHGTEPPERVAAIRSRFAVEIVKVFAVSEASDFSRVRVYEPVADRLLFDAKAPQGASRSGGHGTAFDWQLLGGRTFSRPWFLAGGLSPENVALAIATSGAPGVDVSSGVETSIGIKSATLIADFIANARGARFASKARA